MQKGERGEECSTPVGKGERGGCVAVLDTSSFVSSSCSTTTTASTGAASDDVAAAAAVAAVAAAAAEAASGGRTATLSLSQLLSTCVSSWRCATCEGSNRQ